MSLEGVRRDLAQFGLEQRILVLPERSATVAEAAHALHTELDRIAKTVSLLMDDAPILIVVSGLSRIDNHKYKAQFGKKARMIPFEQVEALTSHPVGGVCPFGLPEGVRVFLDRSLQRYDTVFPACGSVNSAIELSLPELEQASRAEGWVDVAADPE